MNLTKLQVSACATETMPDCASGALAAAKCNQEIPEVLSDLPILMPLAAFGDNLSSADGRMNSEFTRDCDIFVFWHAHVGMSAHALVASGHSVVFAI